ncbi:hypothetical protein [Thalassobacterium sedimentorum]|uniref:hypothetical protein n=1 Tax=Thalassobacterium sedimentorum TaxID=3041258 RepID=UPI002811F592|nr:hypothetical protein [Coraliomargarita sp. SDUM461004]
MNPPWLQEAFLFKFHAAFGVLADLVALFVVALAHEFDRTTAAGLVAVDPENLTYESQPATVYETGERLVFPRLVNVMPVEIVTGDVAFAARHAADAFLQFVQARDILLAVAFDLTGGLARDGGFVFLWHFSF